MVPDSGSEYGDVNETDMEVETQLCYVIVVVLVVVVVVGDVVVAADAGFVVVATAAVPFS